MQSIRPQPRRSRPRKTAAADPDIRQVLIRAGIALLTKQGFTASAFSKRQAFLKGRSTIIFPVKRLSARR